MTQSLEDYLETIYVLSEGAEGSEGAQVRDIALALEVKMPSVVKAMRELMRLGLAEHEPYANVTLTVKGKRLARLVKGRHVLLRDFLQKLGVGRRAADRDACLMEHILSAETLERIRDFTEREGQNDEKPDQHAQTASGTRAHARRASSDR